MDYKYSNFMDQIPVKNIQEDEKYFGSDIALFKPKTYITNKVIHSVDFHIFLLSSPPPDIYINGKQNLLDHGKLFVINPDESVTFGHAPQTKPFTSILIKPTLIKKIAEEIGLSGNIKFLKLQNNFSSDLIHAIRSFDKEIKRPDNFAMLIDSIGIQIVCLLLRECKTNLRKYPLSLPNVNAYVNLAKEYMHVFFSSNITVEDLCDEIHVSPYHFIRTFKQETGLTPHQYLLNVRIEKAKEMLQTRQYSVDEVAKLCGFVSLPHFSNTFKASTGHSPRDYKKLIIKI